MRRQRGSPPWYSIIKRDVGAVLTANQCSRKDREIPNIQDYFLDLDYRELRDYGKHCWQRKLQVMDEKLLTREKEVTGEIPQAQSCNAYNTSTLTRMAQQHMDG